MARPYTTQIIELVKLHPILYDFTLLDYKNFSKKDEVWQYIAATMGTSVPSAKKKWKNVRDNYSKYCRARKLSKDNKYSRRYTLSEKLSFLTPYLQPPRSKTNNNNASSVMNTVNLLSESDNEESMWYDNDVANSNDSREDPLKREEVPLDEYVPQDIKLETNDTTQNQSENKGILATLLSTDKKHSEDSNFYDDIDLICLGYAKTIKKFNPKRQSIIKFKIARLIMEEELAQEIENGGNIEDHPQSDPFA